MRRAPVLCFVAVCVVGVAVLARAALVGRWPFDEGAGTNTVDTSESGRDGALEGAPLPVWTSGIASNGLEFDGAQNEVRVPHEAGLTPSNALTVLAWVKAATNATGEIVAKWSTNAVAGSYLLSLSNGVSEFELMLDGSYTTVAGTTGLADTNWHQVAGVYDGETMKVYLDTNLVGSASASGAVGRSRTNSQYLASAPAGHVRVWTNAQRTATGPVLDNGTGTSVSWALSNMPATVYLEGVSPSTETNDLKVVLQYQNCLAVTTKVTVVDVASVSWVEKPISPLTNNFDLGGIGGGKAIFPDRPSPTAAPDDYQVVKVIAVIKPPMPDITIYFTSIDVDDPSTNAAPVDHELVTQDNRGDPKTGSFIGGGWSSTFAWGTEPGGTSTVTFITTRQPADNFRVIASPLADFKNGYEAQQNTNNGAIVTKYGVSKTAIPPNYTTEMLTVWRRLWIERDSMTNISSNEMCVIGSVSKAGVGFPTSNWISFASLSGVPQAIDEDEYEGGRLRVILTDKNGATSTPFSDFTVLKSKNIAGGGWSHWNIAIWPAFTTDQITAIKSAYIVQFQMWDDDNFGMFDAPQLVDGGAVLLNAFKGVYIVPHYADDADMGNSTPDRLFIRRLTVLQSWYAINDSQDLTSAPDMWATVVVSGFEGSKELGADSDPDGFPAIYPIPDEFSNTGEEGPIYAQSQNPGGRNASMIFLEAIRENPGLVDQQHVMTHEIGHTGLGWTLHLSGQKIMGAPVEMQFSEEFYPPHKDEIRRITTW